MTLGLGFIIFIVVAGFISLITAKDVMSAG